MEFVNALPLVLLAVVLNVWAMRELWRAHKESPGEPLPTAPKLTAQVSIFMLAGALQHIGFFWLLFYWLYPLGWLWGCWRIWRLMRQKRKKQY